MRKVSQKLLWAKIVRKGLFKQHAWLKMYQIPTGRMKTLINLVGPDWFPKIWEASQKLRTCPRNRKQIENPSENSDWCQKVTTPWNETVPHRRCQPTSRSRMSQRQTSTKIEHSTLSTEFCCVACKRGSCQLLGWQWRTGWRQHWGTQATGSVQRWQLGTGRSLRRRRWCRWWRSACPAQISPLSRWSLSIASLMDIVDHHSRPQRKSKSNADANHHTNL